MKRWIPEFLVAYTSEEGELEEIEGLQDALLPFLASNQHSSRLREFALKHTGGQRPGMLQFLGQFSVPGDLSLDGELVTSINEMLGFSNSANDDAVKILGVT